MAPPVLWNHDTTAGSFESLSAYDAQAKAREMLRRERVQSTTDEPQSEQEAAERETEAIRLLAALVDAFQHSDAEWMARDALAEAAAFLQKQQSPGLPSEASPEQ